MVHTLWLRSTGCAKLLSGVSSPVKVGNTCLDEFLTREKVLRDAGTRFVFPLPTFEVVA